MNPPWNLREDKKKIPGRISFDEFKESFDLPTEVMRDGLVFIWVEKEVIFDLIEFFSEHWNLSYVENVCYVMLDQTKKSAIDATRDIDITEAFEY